MDLDILESYKKQKYLGKMQLSNTRFHLVLEKGIVYTPGNRGYSYFIRVIRINLYIGVVDPSEARWREDRGELTSGVSAVLPRAPQSS